MGKGLKTAVRRKVPITGISEVGAESLQCRDAVLLVSNHNGWSGRRHLLSWK
jgi:hypothetical protein